MIFITGFLALIFVALVICNLGGVSKVFDGIINPHLLFDHQTMENSDNNPNLLPINDFQNNVQLDVEKSLGIDNIVPIAEKKELTGLLTEQGQMDIYMSIPENPVPLHIDELDMWPNVAQEAWKQWFIKVESYGGYEPFYGQDWYNKIYIKQKRNGDQYDTIVGVIDINWIEDPTLYVPSNMHVFFAHFDITWSDRDTDPDPNYDPTWISLDSSFYPEVVTHGDNGWELFDDEMNRVDENDLIPDKEVKIKIKTAWTGCILPEQSFLILSVREKYQFPLFLLL